MKPVIAWLVSNSVWLQGDTVLRTDELICIRDRTVFQDLVDPSEVFDPLPSISALVGLDDLGGIEECDRIWPAQLLKIIDPRRHEVGQEGEKR